MSALVSFDRVFEVLDLQARHRGEARTRSPIPAGRRPGRVPRRALPLPERRRGLAGLAGGRGRPRPHRSPTPVLRGRLFTVEPGQMVALVGPSGAGKSTTVDAGLPGLRRRPPARSWSAASTSATPRWTRCATPSASSPRTRTCSTRRSPRTCATPSRTPPTTRCGRRCAGRRSATWSAACPTASTRSSASAATGSPAARSSASRSPGCCSRHPSIVILDEATAHLDSRVRGGRAAGAGRGAAPGARRWSSRTGSPPSATPTRSWSSTTAGSSSAAPTTTWSRPAGSTRSCTAPSSRWRTSRPAVRRRRGDRHDPVHHRRALTADRAPIPDDRAPSPPILESWSALCPFHSGLRRDRQLQDRRGEQHQRPLARSAARNRANCSARSSIWKWAFRPLGLGSTHTGTPPISRSGCGPIVAFGRRTRPGTRSRPAPRRTAAATGRASAGQDRRRPPTSSSGASSSARAVARATTLVMPRPRRGQHRPARRVQLPRGEPGTGAAPARTGCRAGRSGDRSRPSRGSG